MHLVAGGGLAVGEVYTIAFGSGDTGGKKNMENTHLGWGYTGWVQMPQVGRHRVVGGAWGDDQPHNVPRGFFAWLRQLPPPSTSPPMERLRPGVDLPPYPRGCASC